MIEKEYIYPPALNNQKPDKAIFRPQTAGGAESWPLRGGRPIEEPSVWPRLLSGTFPGLTERGRTATKPGRLAGGRGRFRVRRGG